MEGKPDPVAQAGLEQFGEFQKEALQKASEVAQRLVAGVFEGYSTAITVAVDTIVAEAIKYKGDPKDFKFDKEDLLNDLKMSLGLLKIPSEAFVKPRRTRYEPMTPSPREEEYYDAKDKSEDGGDANNNFDEEESEEFEETVPKKKQSTGFSFFDNVRL